MARLRVPERHKQPLKRLLTLPEGDITQFRNALNEVSPSQSFAVLTARLTSRVDLPSETVLDVMGLLFSLALNAYRAGVELSDTATDAIVAAEEAALLPDGGDDGQEQRDTLQARLGGLLEAKALSISAKAAWLASQYDRQFVECAIYSDIRTVFSSAGEDSIGPAGAFVTHNLMIEFHDGPEHRHSSEFFALDSEDLRELQSAIERALTKEEELRELILHNDLRYISLD